MKKLAFLLMACIGITANAQQELIQSIQDDNLSAFNALITSAQINECIEDTDSDYTVLTLAIATNAKQIFEAIMNNDRTDVNMTCRTTTPLMEAASSKQYEMVKALIEAGADKTKKDSYGHTAYDIAVMRGDLKSSALLK